MLGFATFSYAQEDGFETISFGADFFRRETLPKPIVREVISATVIQVQYEGDEWEQNLEKKSAFEYACRLLEEQMKTAIPLKVTVKFGKLRGQNVIAKTITQTDSCIIFPQEEKIRIPRATLKWVLRDRGTSDANHLKVDFFDFSDGSITFNEDDIFSYSLDEVVEDKYDFVTVALRELCKVMGFSFGSAGNNVTKVIDLFEDKLLLYDKIVLSGKYNDPAKAYNYATSGNVVIPFGYYGSGAKYSMYSPTVFENGRSLSYFKVDETNDETRLMQPDLPRGTSIRHIGKWFKPFLEAMGWYSSIAVGGGGGGGGQGDVTSTSTDKVAEYGKELSFKISTNKNALPVAISNCQNSNKMSDMSDYDGIMKYVGQFNTYPELDLWPGSGYPLLGWSVSILRKDGTWDIVMKTHYMLSEIHFSTSKIDPVKALDYARSSDGYLRCKIARVDDYYYSGNPLDGSRPFARLFLLDYLPQKPQLAFSKVMPQSRASGDEYYADVKIAFKNVEGTESILVEQLEEGSPVPFTFYVEDIRAGYFIASVDKEYSTTFRLRAMNKNGETISEQLLVSPLVSATYTLSSRVDKNVISLELRNSRKKNISKVITDYKVLDLNSSMIVQEGKVLDNNIDINSLGKGVYGLQVTDENGNFHSTKFIK